MRVIIIAALLLAACDVPDDVCIPVFSSTVCDDA